jgi:hypothetical protein
MSDGVYILETKDGYRVAYCRDYDDFFVAFNDSTLNYSPNGARFKLVFGKCKVFDDKKDAMNEAFDIVKTIGQTDDGIMFIGDYLSYTFEDVINGKATQIS